MLRAYSGVAYIIAVVGILGGALLGARYRVFCLVPVIMLGIAGIITLDRITGVSLGSTALAAIVLAVTLHIGYVAGIAVRSALVGAPQPSMVKAKNHGDRFATTF